MHLNEKLQTVWVIREFYETYLSFFRVLDKDLTTLVNAARYIISLHEWM